MGLKSKTFRITSRKSFPNIQKDMKKLVGPRSLRRSVAKAGFVGVTGFRENLRRQVKEIVHGTHGRGTHAAARQLGISWRVAKSLLAS